jgi:hypothetical protein
MTKDNVRKNCVVEPVLDGEPCAGHVCVSCDKRYYCGDKHECKRKKTRGEMGNLNTRPISERLAAGFEVINQDERKARE